jgi:RNA-binding protein Tab2/Atab2
MIWQADFYRRPLKDDNGQPLWELLVCDRTGRFRYHAFCPQSQANANWLVTQLRQAAVVGNELPKTIEVFRPQSLTLLEAAGRNLGIQVEATRRTSALKQYLRVRSQQYPIMNHYTGESYKPLALDKPPPVPLAENLWGERWRFATLAAGEIEDTFGDRIIPILDMPEFLLPVNLGIASTVSVPGVIIDGGRQSMQLARWIEESRPVALNYVVGAPDGLVLEVGLIDRWIVATFEDQDVAAAGQMYEERKKMSQGLHFLLVQPDDSGMTYSGFWLLQEQD